MVCSNLLNAALVVAAVLPVSTRAEVFFLPLGDLPGGEFASIARAISADGTTIVGYSESEHGTEAFVWRDGVMQGLGDLPGGSFNSAAVAVSADGRRVAGWSSGTAGTGAAVWQDGVVSELPLPPGWHGQAVHVSANGSVIVGYGEGRILRWIDGQYVSLPLPPNSLSANAEGISADGQTIVGSAQVIDAGTRAFKWHEGQFEYLDDLDSPAHSQAWGISADGGVVFGESRRTGASSGTAARWMGQAVEPLTDLPEFLDSIAYAASADGSVIVGRSTRPFLWTELDGMRALSDVLRDDFGIGLPGWVLHDAYGVSADGRFIVGYGRNPSGHLEAWLVGMAYRCSRTDIDFDRDTDLTDLAILLTHYGSCSVDPAFFPPADVDRRGCVDLGDLALLLAEFGMSCP